ncbi:hypothetical protein W04_2851 [Pseudoalteromonas sp. SW0106-04]|nr:hypothetical protein W04_2851 [Pseudoalteromonas sp. SW0106-04]
MIELAQSFFHKLDIKTHLEKGAFFVASLMTKSMRIGAINQDD